LIGNRMEASAALARLKELDPLCSIEAVQRRCLITEPGGIRVLEGLRRAGLPQSVIAPAMPEGVAITTDDPDAEMTLRPAPRHRAEPIHLLLVSRPGEPVRDVTLGAAPLLIGRAADADLVLHDNKVSRAHCRIMLTAQGVTATDLNSTNGTLVDGRPITRTTPLKPGAVLQIGSFRLEYQRDEQVDPDGTMVATLPHGHRSSPGSEELA
ncbi:MAG: FHA domain-containing protein, partial [Acetobacteraceae bacterium]